MIAGDTLGIGHDPSQHAAYVGSWINALANDPLEIVRAAGDAEKIHDYVMAFEQQQVQQQDQQQTTQAEPEPVQVQEAREIVLATDSGTYYTGAEIEPWTDDARDARVYTEPAEAQAAAVELQTRQAEYLEDSRLALHLRDPENPRVTVPCTPETQAEAAPQQAPTPAEIPPSELPERVQVRLDIWVGITQGAAEKLEEIRTNNVLGTRYAAEHWVDTRPAIAETYERIGTALGKIMDDRQRETARQYLADRLPQSYVTPAEAAFFPGDQAADLPPPAWARGPVLAAAPTTTQQATTSAPTGQDTPQNQQQGREDRTYIQVPYRAKDEAKALGAKWDRGAQSWYVPGGADLAQFEKWPQQQQGQAPARPAPAADGAEALRPTSEQPAPAAETARQYLAVPYEERAAAKAAGAHWDQAAKSWYVGPNADTAKLERWNAEKVQAQQGPAMIPREEFADALRAIGCVVSGAHPIMDGQKHRITVAGEKHSEQGGAGFYVGHLDGHPAGFMKNNKTGAAMKWKSKGYSMDPEAKAALAAEAAGKLQARAAEQERLHEQTAQRVAQQMGTLHPVTEPTPYMQAKGIDPQPGVFTDKAGRETFIPAIDATGKQWSVQYVQQDGTKRFAKDSRKEGCFHPVGGNLAALEKAPALVIGEGYATASSLSEALGFPTVAAFDSGNLPAVAKALHERMPDKPIVIAGDDDRHLEQTQGVNPGRKKAEEAAQAVGGKAVFPIFAPGEQARDPKGFTDFNDVATKSALGMEGVQRQVRAVVDDVIERDQAQRQEQQQTQRQTRQQERVPRPRRSAKIA